VYGPGFFKNSDVHARTCCYRLFTPLRGIADSLSEQHVVSHERKAILRAV